VSIALRPTCGRFETATQLAGPPSSSVNLDGLSAAANGAADAVVVWTTESSQAESGQVQVVTTG
jgi:hypothetical protein